VSAKSDARVDALIGLLYEAAVDPGLWTGLAANIAHTFDSTSTVLKTHGGDDRVQLIEITDNLVVPRKHQAWADHWHRNDIWVERSVAFGMSRVITNLDLISNAEFEKSGFYQDWNRKLEIYHMIGAVFPVDQAVGVLGIHRVKRAGAYGRMDRERVSRFLPHLERALRIRSRLGDVSLANRGALEALDRLDTGVIVADRECCVLHMNRVASAFLVTQSQMRVHCGRLTFTDPRLEAELLRRVTEAAGTAAGTPGPPTAALLVEREDRLPFTILVTPLPATADPAGSQAPAVMVFIKDPEDGAAVHETLRELFGLTRTEAAIAAALVKGHDIAQIARSFRIGIGTARSHLKAVLTKTGTHRQAQLVALITRSVAVISPAPRRAGNERPAE
jgi:DNA-binding CsgD family transcriptional regulator